MALCLVPMLPIWLTAIRGDGEIKALQGFGETLGAYYFRMVNALVCLFLGCAVLGEDIDNKTLPYLLTRAIPRGALVLGRFLTFWLNASAMLVPAFVLVYAFTLLPMGAEAFRYGLPVLGASLLALVLSTAAYGGVFVLLSVVFRKPLLVGIGLLFLWESWAAVGPSALRPYTVAHQAFVLMTRWTDLPAYRLVAEDPATGTVLLEAADSLQTLLGIPLVTLIVTYLYFRRRELTG